MAQEAVIAVQFESLRCNARETPDGPMFVFSAQATVGGKQQVIEWRQPMSDEDIAEWEKEGRVDGVVVPIEADLGGAR